MKHLFGSMSVLAVLCGSLGAPAVAQAEVNVVASIKPIHSLVASVMEGVGTPSLVVDGGGSPHTYSLRPSTARKIANADVVFWVGPQMESFLETPLENLAGSATVVDLKDAGGLRLLQFRKGGNFEEHEHEEPAGEDDHEDHEDEAFDMHLWLDPQNALAMLTEIEQALATADPANASEYAANAKAEAAEIKALAAKLKEDLKQHQGKSFVVFHDAYRYFEEAFDLKAVGSVTISPEVLPGARRLSQVRGKLKNLGVTCVFSEAQFNPRMVEVLKEGTSVNTAELDPLGSTLEAGPQLYTQLLKGMGTAFNACLTEQS